MRVTLLSVLLATSFAWADPLPARNLYSDDWQAALADARKLPPEIASFTLYLTLRHSADAADRDELRTTVDLWVNSLSRESTLIRPRRIGQNLVAINTYDYGWDHDVLLSALALEDPYFHVQLFVQANTVHKTYFAREAGSKAGWYESKILTAKKISAIAPWVPSAEAAELVALTNSPAPLLRADWFLSRTMISFGRKGTGYYDVLRLKDRADFDKLIEFDRKKSQGIRREVAAIVARSGVANFPRQIFREQALTGGRWETRDRITDNLDAGNALRQLDGDFKHEAEELYGVLPNRLFVFFLSDAAGKRQDSAPDGIGFDATSTGRDGKIHVGLGCCRCHAEGLRPINDWARRVYTGPLQLNSPDYEKVKRLRGVYLGELQETLEDDRVVYEKALFRLTGWKPGEAAKAVGRVWAAYVEADILPGSMAREFGCTEAEYLKKLRAYAQANPLTDPVMASHIADPPIAIRRDDIEQLMPILAQVVLEVGK